jgi:hypothetical protein
VWGSFLFDATGSDNSIVVFDSQYSISYCGNGTSVAGCSSGWKSLYVYPLGNHMQHSFASLLAVSRSSLNRGLSVASGKLLASNVYFQEAAC